MGTSAFSVLGCAAFAVCCVSEARADEMPIRNADRPGTLPRDRLRLDALMAVSRAPTEKATWGGLVGLGFGLTDTIEIGGQLLPVRVSPEPAITAPLLYVAYLLVPGDWTVVPTLQASVPLRGSESWAVDALVTVSGVLWSRLIVTVVPIISTTFSNPVSVTMTLSLPLALQVTPRLQLELHTGVGLSRFDPLQQTSRSAGALDFNHASVPLGGGFIYTVGHENGPFADIGLQFIWPSLLAATEGGAALAAEDWSLFLTVSTYLAP